MQKLTPCCLECEIWYVARLISALVSISLAESPRDLLPWQLKRWSGAYLRGWAFTFILIKLLF